MARDFLTGEEQVKGLERHLSVQADLLGRRHVGGRRRRLLVLLVVTRDQERAARGLFLGFQHPEEIPGVKGLTDEMITQLGGLSPQRLRVIARTSSMR